MKNTPGPWTWFVRNPELQEPQMKFFVGSNKQGFAHTVGLNEEEDLANARLIAKAPEMYEALKWFVERVERGEVHSKKTYARYKSILEEIDNDRN